MNAALPLQSLGLPPFDQICLVVPDLKVALTLYEPLFGPFMVLENGPFDSVYRGEASRAELKVAFGRSGDIEIELVEWVAGATPHRDFVQQGRQGIQHIRYTVDCLDRWANKAGGLGYVPVWSGTYPAHAISWCYLERVGDPLMIELLTVGSAPASIQT